MTRALVLLSCLVIGALAAAQGAVPRVTIEVEPNPPLAGVNFTIIVVIQGTSVTSVATPEASGVQIRSEPRLFTSNVNGAITIKKYYAARAEKPGSYTLKPVEVYVDGRAFQSEPHTFNVAKEPEAPKRDAGPRSVSAEETALMKVRTDKTVAYEGEAILLSVELWRLDDPSIVVSGLRGIPMSEPAITGFYVVPAEGLQETDTMSDGLRYRVGRNRKWLFATAPGDYTIGSWQWYGQVRQNRFGVRPISIQPESEPIHLSIKPLPARPANFSGAVGQFDIGASLSSDNLLLGQPFTLSLTIAGEGNPEAIAAPPLPDLEGVHVSGPSSTVATDTDGPHLAATKEFTYTLVPGEVGTLRVPPVTFVYFDPETEQYVTKRTKEFDVAIKANPEGQHRVMADGGSPVQSAVEVQTEGIRANEVLDGPLYAQAPPGAGVAAAAAGIPALVYAGAALWMARRRRFAADSRLARSHFARSRGRKRLADVAHASDPAEALYRALIGFIADKLHVPEEGLTSADVNTLLKQNQIDESIAASIGKTLRACERARYGGGSLSAQEVQALMESAAVNIDRLDDDLRARGESGS